MGLHLHISTYTSQVATDAPNFLDAPSHSPCSIAPGNARTTMPPCELPQRFRFWAPRFSAGDAGFSACSPPAACGGSAARCGFSPRARRDAVTVTHTDASGAGRFVAPLGTPIGPGDTVFVGERWF